MAKTKAKTVPTEASVSAFLADLMPQRRRDDAAALAALMERATGASRRLWAGNIVGFGDWHYHYASGHEGDTFRVGFAPRKTALVVYLMGGLDKHGDALAVLGKWKRGSGCLYVTRLADVDLTVLEAMVARADRELG